MVNGTHKVRNICLGIFFGLKFQPESWKKVTSRNKMKIKKEKTWVKISLGFEAKVLEKSLIKGLLETLLSPIYQMWFNMIAAVKLDFYIFIGNIATKNDNSWLYWNKWLYFHFTWLCWFYFKSSSFKITRKTI